VRDRHERLPSWRNAHGEIHVVVRPSKERPRQRGVEDDACAIARLADSAPGSGRIGQPTEGDVIALCGQGALH
jgi:hypothetical protein